MSAAPTGHDASARSPRPMGRPPELAERLLFQEALTVAKNAYAPYSGYAVGAVVVGSSGRSHHGANVENASSPAGLCAERAALAALVTYGERGLRYVAVAALDGSDCLPCGFCLQALSEFGAPELVVRSGGELVVLHLRDLLPAPFTLASDGAEAAAGPGRTTDGLGGVAGVDPAPGTGVDPVRGTGAKPAPFADDEESARD